MYVWMVGIAVIVLILLALYSQVGQGEGAIFTVPLSVTCFAAALYGTYKATIPFTVILSVVAGLLMLSVFISASWGMPRPGGLKGR